jgi:hypothetical protein
MKAGERSSAAREAPPVEPVSDWPILPARRSTGARMIVPMINESENVRLGIVGGIVLVRPVNETPGS